MKIKILSTLFLLSLLFSHCSFIDNKKNQDQPQQLIPKEKMIVILADMQITEAYLKQLRKAGYKVKDTSLIYYTKVFKKNKITKSIFEQSLLYYKRDLQDLEKMYTDVIIRLNELKAKNEELIIEMKADSLRQDSIQKAQKVADSIEKIEIYADSVMKANFVLDSIHLQTDSSYLIQ